MLVSEKFTELSSAWMVGIYGGSGQVLLHTWHLHIHLSTSSNESDYCYPVEVLKHPAAASRQWEIPDNHQPQIKLYFDECSQEKEKK